VPRGAPAAGVIGAAYDASAAAWAGGPERLYAALADALLDRAPVPLAGRRVADVGTGTGVAARALAARGAVAYGVDLSVAMLRHGVPGRGAAGDAGALPFRDASLGGVVYAFCLNHLPDPVAALREAARVAAPGGAVLGSVFAEANDHPAKEQVDAVLRAYGWQAPGWHDALKDTTEPLLATPERFAAAATAAGLRDVDAVETLVETGLDDARGIAAWRLGMAHVAPFLAGLSATERAALTAETERSVDPVPVRPRVVLLAATGP